VFRAAHFGPQLSSVQSAASRRSLRVLSLHLAAAKPTLDTSGAVHKHRKRPPFLSAAPQTRVGWPTQRQRQRQRSRSSGLCLSSGLAASPSLLLRKRSTQFGAPTTRATSRGPLTRPEPPARQTDASSLASMVGGQIRAQQCAGLQFCPNAARHERWLSFVCLAAVCLLSSGGDEQRHASRARPSSRRPKDTGRRQFAADWPRQVAAASLQLRAQLHFGATFARVCSLLCALCSERTSHTLFCTLYAGDCVPQTVYCMLQFARCTVHSQLCIQRPALRSSPQTRASAEWEPFPLSTFCSFHSPPLAAHLPLFPHSPLAICR